MFKPIELDSNINDLPLTYDNIFGLSASEWRFYLGDVEVQCDKKLSKRFVQKNLQKLSKLYYSYYDEVVDAAIEVYSPYVKRKLRPKDIDRELVMDYVRMFKGGVIIIYNSVSRSTFNTKSTLVLFISFRHNWGYRISKYDWK